MRGRKLTDEGMRGMSAVKEKGGEGKRCRLNEGERGKATQTEQSENR